MRKLLKVLGVAVLTGCLIWSEAAFAFRGGVRGGFHRGGFHQGAVRGGHQVWQGRWGGTRPGLGGSRWAGGRYGYYRPGVAAATAVGLAATSPYWGGYNNGGTACGPYAYYDQNYGCVPYQR